MKTGNLLLCFQLTLVLFNVATNDVFGQKRFQCSLNNRFHHNSTCPELLKCDGGKIKLIEDTVDLKPCYRCASPIIIEAGFNDIRIPLSFAEHEAVIDIIGKGDVHGVYRLRKGLALRINSRPVRSVEYTFSNTLYDAKQMINSAYFQTLGLNFSGCRADTVGYRNVAAGPAMKFYTIAYRGGCVIAQPMFKNENVSTYFYDLRFEIRPSALTSTLEKIVLTLRNE